MKAKTLTIANVIPNIRYSTKSTPKNPRFEVAFSIPESEPMMGPALNLDELAALHLSIGILLKAQGMEI